MADTPTPPPAPNGDNKPRSPRGKVNKEWLQEVSKTESIVKTAEKPEYAGIIIVQTNGEGDINPAFFALLKGRIVRAKELINQAITKTVGKEVMTDAESIAQTNLVNGIREVQKRANQKYADTTPLVLKDYFVGAEIDTNRPLLETVADSIIEKLKTDTLPKIDAAKKTALATLSQAYKDSQSGQSGEQAGATSARAGLEELVGLISGGRRKLQFAADADWPHTDPKNAGIRVEFQLPADRPFVG